MGEGEGFRVGREVITAAVKSHSPCPGEIMAPDPLFVNGLLGDYIANGEED